MYFFHIEYLNKNEFNGELKALGLNNADLTLGDNYDFKVNDKPIKYILNDDEIDNRHVEIKIKITVYNCPNCDNSKKQEIVSGKEFYFIITVYDDSTEKAEESTEKAEESTEKAEESTEKAEENTEKPEDTTEKAESSETIIHCLDNYTSHYKEKDIYYYICPNYNKDEVIDNINDIIDKIDKNKNYIIEGKDYTTKITPIDYSDPDANTNTELFSPSTYANFSNCESILRGYNNLLSPKKITFVQIEINNTIDDILVNQIEYKAYDNKTELNLSLCDNETIKIFYSFKNTTTDKIDFINYFKNKSIDILDINDPFFNDICTSYSESGKDLTLNDRIQEIYKKLYIL